MEKLTAAFAGEPKDKLALVRLNASDMTQDDPGG